MCERVTRVRQLATLFFGYMSEVSRNSTHPTQTSVQPGGARLTEQATAGNKNLKLSTNASNSLQNSEESSKQMEVDEGSENNGEKKTAGLDIPVDEDDPLGLNWQLFGRENEELLSFSEVS